MRANNQSGISQTIIDVSQEKISEEVFGRSELIVLETFSKITGFALLPYR
jgi:hypothetical protein